jgi:hypothetical protein
MLRLSRVKRSLDPHRRAAWGNDSEAQANSNLPRREGDATTGPSEVQRAEFSRGQASLVHRGKEIASQDPSHLPGEATRRAGTRSLNAGQGHGSETAAGRTPAPRHPRTRLREVRTQAGDGRSRSGSRRTLPYRGSSFRLWTSCPSWVSALGAPRRSKAIHRKVEAMFGDPKITDVDAGIPDHPAARKRLADDRPGHPPGRARWSPGVLPQLPTVR